MHTCYGQTIVTKSGPKSGPAHPVTVDFKEAARLRLSALGWSQTKLADEVGVTRGAISHLFNTAKQSSLVPAIEKALGMGPRVPAVPRELDTSGPVKRQSLHRAFELERRPLDEHVDSEDGRYREINDLFFVLDDFNRARLLERARVLYEAQRTADMHREVLAYSTRYKEKTETTVELRDALRGAIELMEARLGHFVAAGKPAPQDLLHAIQKAKGTLEQTRPSRAADRAALRAEETAKAELEDLRERMEAMGIPVPRWAPDKQT